MHRAEGDPDFPEQLRTVLQLPVQNRTQPIVGRVAAAGDAALRAFTLSPLPPFASLAALCSKRILRCCARW